MDNNLLSSHGKTLVVAPTGSGKTTAVIDSLLESEERLLIVTPTIALAKQIAAPKYDTDGTLLRRELPVHYSGHTISPTERVVVTVYDHIYTFARDGRTLVVDEIHNIITALSYRRRTIENLRKCFVFFRRIVGLTGTHIDCRFWADWHIIHFEPTDNSNQRTLTRQPFYKKSLYAEAAKTIESHVSSGRQVFVYMQDKTDGLASLIAELTARCVTSVSTLNSTTLRSGELDLTGATEVIETGRFSTDVLITTFAEGISILNQNVTYIAFESDYVSLAQSLSRLRHKPFAAILLSNADMAIGRDYDSEAATERNKLIAIAKIKLDSIMHLSENLDALEALVSCDPDGNLLDKTASLNYTEIEYRVLVELNMTMQKYQCLLASALQRYNVHLVNGRAWPIDADNIAEQPTKAGVNKMKRAGRAKSAENYFNGSKNEPHVHSVFVGLVNRLGFSEVDAEQFIKTEWVRSAKAYDTLVAQHAIAYSDAAAPLRKLLTTRLSDDEFYTADELRAIVSQCVAEAGYAISGSELDIARALYDVERTTTKVDGQLINGYTLNTDNDW